eukprot:TRINITY_DN324_c2_g1_i2.p1 TRINITY_DN324_c2_g1~~TRINITY_DN324_c2_g1_i2.p1  ORF type:complete len:949 (+),score=240.97 TRINITY_DN324_c2_g1_i2:155-3001(+)
MDVKVEEQRQKFLSAWESLHSIVIEKKDDDEGKLRHLSHLSAMDTETKGDQEPSPHFATLFDNYVPFAKTMRLLLCDVNRYIRIATYRFLRKLFTTKTALSALFAVNIHFIVAKDFEMGGTDREALLIRKEAVHFIGVCVQRYPLGMPKTLAKALVSIVDCATEPEDLRVIALSYLLALASQNPTVTARSNGLDILSRISVDSAFLKFSDQIVHTLSYLVNFRPTRMVLRAGGMMNFHPVQAAYTKSEKIPESFNWKHFQRVGIIAMKSWPGLYCMMDGRSGLQTIVEMIRVATEERHQIALLDFIFGIIESISPNRTAGINWKEPESEFEFLTSVDYTLKTRSKISSKLQKNRATSKEHAINLVDNYLALVMHLLLQFGVLRCLFDLSVREGLSAQLRGKISRLLFLLFSVIESVISPSVAQSYQDEMEKMLLERQESFTFRLPLLRKGVSKRHLEDISVLKDSSMTKPEVMTAIRDTNVVLTKDYTKWDWDLIRKLLRGPLLNNASTLEEVMGKTKFTKRLLSFFRPEKRRFSVIPFFTANEQLYTETGKALLETIVSTELGLVTLRNSKILNQVYFALHIEAEGEDVGAGDREEPSGRWFSRAQAQKTMTRDYFQLIGLLSNLSRGTAILVEFGFFPILEKLVMKRDDLAQLIIKHIDVRGMYGRNLLRSAALRATNRIRFVTAIHIRSLIVNADGDVDVENIHLLHQMLSDPWEEIAKTARSILEEACTVSEDYLEALISITDDVSAFDVPGCSILMRFVSSEEGFKRIREHVDTLRESWLDVECEKYSRLLDKSLKEAMEERGSMMSRRSRSVFKPSDGSVYLPVHLYGELVKHHEGVRYVREKDDVEHFKKFLGGSDWTMDGSESSIERQKAAIWALGWCGTSLDGFHIIEEKGIPEIISHGAFHHTNLTLRGVCFYVLGMWTGVKASRKKASNPWLVDEKE